LTSCFLSQISSSGVIAASFSDPLNKAVLVDDVVDSVGFVVVELDVAIDVVDIVVGDVVVEVVVVGDVLLLSSAMTCSMKMSLNT